MTTAPTSRPERSLVSVGHAIAAMGATMVVVVALASGCQAPPSSNQPPSDFSWELPEGVPAPAVPDDNPMSLAKIELGRHLFYDQRLSGNQTQSCGSCHLQAKGFADGRSLPEGSTGHTVPRNSQGLLNVAYHATLTWMNPNFFEIEEQVLVPLFGELPVELGITGKEDEVLARFAADEQYQYLFAEAFPEDTEVATLAQVVNALAAFVRSMVSFRSPYDRYVYGGDTSALSAAQQRGMNLFFEERLDCHHCHGGLQFSMNFRHENSVFFERGFANNGLYNIGGTGDYPAENEGLSAFTGNDADRGKMRIPTLRNIAVTSPYMHDGSIATLEEVLRMYEAGGRNLIAGPLAGDGRAHPNKSEFVHGFDLSDRDRADLLSFFDALTDAPFLADPRYSDPFAE